MSVIQTFCRGCNTKLQGPLSAAGKSSQCPKCRISFTFPYPGSPNAAVKEEEPWLAVEVGGPLAPMQQNPPVVSAGFQCPDCRRPISRHAYECPGCGYPLRDRAPVRRNLREDEDYADRAIGRRGDDRRPVLIEQTGKTWKAQLIFAILVGMLSGLIFVVGASAKPKSEGAIAIGAIGVFVSFIWLIVARLGAWWNHG
jgi:hypothetical protein